MDSSEYDILKNTLKNNFIVYSKNIFKMRYFQKDYIFKKDKSMLGNDKM